MSEWIEWNGGECPTSPGVSVEARLRSGLLLVRTAARLQWGRYDDSPGSEIVAYRRVVAKPTVSADAEPASPRKALDRQEGGDHYKDCAIQPAEYIHANGLGFFEGNVVKYVTRWRKKNGLADLRKAAHYIELLIELEEAKMALHTGVKR